MRKISERVRAYLSIISISFQNSSAYRLDTIFRILSSIISVIAYEALWKAIYISQGKIENIDLKMLTTHYVISLGLTTIFYYMGSDIPDQIISGDITTDLQKPVSFHLFQLFKTVGSILFDFIIIFIPTYIISYFFIGIIIPQSILNIILCIFSLILGFLIYFHISYLISLISFWIVKIDFIVQLKNALITIFSGVFLPIWFFPDKIKTICEYTPFKSIYYIPEMIYMGKIGGEEIILSFVKQLIWLVFFIILCKLVWKLGIKKITVAGG